eukprot:SAG31_NODE_410_length_15989_cov_237.233984_2_plen_204_part_00
MATSLLGRPVCTWVLLRCFSQFRDSPAQHTVGRAAARLAAERRARPSFPIGRGQPRPITEHLSRVSLQHPAGSVPDAPTSWIRWPAVLDIKINVHIALWQSGSGSYRVLAHTQLYAVRIAVVALRHSRSHSPAWPARSWRGCTRCTRPYMAHIYIALPRKFGIVDIRLRVARRRGTYTSTPVCTPALYTWTVAMTETSKIFIN